MNGNWIDIKNSLPPPDTGILVTDGRIVTAAQLGYDKDQPFYWLGHHFGGYEWDFDFSESFSAGAITHWMPLPDAPQG